MNINIPNCRENLKKSLDEVSSILEPLQEENPDVRTALAHVRFLYIEAITALDEYQKLKETPTTGCTPGH